MEAQLLKIGSLNFKTKGVFRCVFQRLFDISLQGSWHSTRRHICQYCAAVRQTQDGDDESLLFTAYGPSAAHRATRIQTREEWEATHESNFLTRLVGFKPQSAYVCRSELFGTQKKLIDVELGV